MTAPREATPAFRSVLYREPRLYDLVFPDGDGATAAMLRMAIDRYLPAPPRSMLDVGCGTGQHLKALAKTIPECCAVDLLESSVPVPSAVGMCGDR